MKRRTFGAKLMRPVERKAAAAADGWSMIVLAVIMMWLGGGTVDGCVGSVSLSLTGEVHFLFDSIKIWVLAKLDGRGGNILYHA